MATVISSVRIQLLYKRGARLFHDAVRDGAMPIGVQNGYAITAFDSELELRSAVKTFKYSELFQQYEWKVGTAETTKPRWQRMFHLKKVPTDPVSIWERLYIPLNDRLSKYQGDTKSREAGQCAWLRDVVRRYDLNNHISFLMLPLALGFHGTDKQLEREMSDMIVKAGGEVHNDKKKQGAKERAASTQALIGLDDAEYGVDKLLPLTPHLKKIGFRTHPSFNARRK